MENYSQTPVSGLRKILLESGKFTQIDVDNIKGKAKLVEAVMSLSETEDVKETNFSQLFSSAEIEKEENVTENNENIVSTPSYLSYEWHDYVMSLFHPNELQDGKYPKVDGLRRVAELLIGEITFSGPSQVTPPDKPDVPGRATVVYQVQFNTNSGEKVFSAVAGSWIGNTDDEYSAFPEPIAETRAEARALRRALRLRVASAEELTKKDTATFAKQAFERNISNGEWKESDTISSTQLTFLKKNCEKLDIDFDKFINSGKDKFDDVNNIPKIVALEMIQRLNDYQNSGKKSLAIPEEIKINRS